MIKLATFLFYNFILIGSTFFVYISEKTNNKNKRATYLLISFTILVLPVALRFGIGVDYLNYVGIFDLIDSGYSYSTDEWGFFYINYIISKLGLSYQWVFVIIAVITYLPITLSYPQKYRTIFHFVTISLIYIDSFSQMRTIASSGIMFFAIMEYTHDFKKIKFIIFILLASSIHISSLLLGVAVLLGKYLYKPTKKLSFIILAIIIIAITIILRYGEEIGVFLITSSIGEELGFSSYATSDFGRNNLSIDSILGRLSYAVILFAPLIYTKRILRENKTNIIPIICILCCILFLTFGLKILIFTRLAKNIFSIAFALSPLLILNTYGIKHKRYIVLIIATFSFLVFNINFMTSDIKTCSGRRVMPYVSIFNKDSESAQRALSCKDRNSKTNRALGRQL